MRCVILYLMLLFPSSGIFAQNNLLFTIKGKVLDKTHAPVPHAFVVLDSSAIYTQTDSLGNYKLQNVSAGRHTVTVQSIGFITQSQKVTGSTGEMQSLNFLLEEEILSMDEVLIVAETEKVKLENSAKAVHVIETKEAKLKSADMGEVLAQTQGVSVRRSGGLGSGTRFSLNGLSGEQVRFFLDGIPLEFSGYIFGISNIPVNLVDRIEIYKGVVPIQFGADALGGAVNIVSPKVRYGFSGSASYQTGSFGTHRIAADIKYLDDSTGFFVSGGGFFDYAKNNYKVDVQVPNEKGKLKPAKLRRFHDAYKAQGVNFTLGVKNKTWAKELSIKGFYSGYSKEVQHNLTMEGIPYGEVMRNQKSAGANLLYHQDLGEKVSVKLLAGFSSSERQYVDTSRNVYDWRGNIVARNLAGEAVGSIVSNASHQYTWDQNLYSRILGSWKISANHSLRFSAAPTFTYRTGEEKFANTYDPAEAKGRMFNWVNGIEYELNAFSGKLQNILFVKDYRQDISIEEVMPNLDKPLVTSRKVHFYGFGNGVRFQFAPRFAAKASYEYAIRLPRPDELFGDGQFTANNLELKPERSHNVNVELTYKNNQESSSKWFVQPNLFLRDIKDLIFFNIGVTDLDNVYQNLADALSIGAEINAGWTSPEERFYATINTTYQYYYNNSKEGFYDEFYFERMPNMPYFFTNGSAGYTFKNVLNKNGQLSPFWNMRYIHRFYISWESAGKNVKEFKDEIPDQQVHGVGLTYRLVLKNYTYALTGEIQNLLDRKVYDFYGVQKPGRAAYAKLTFQF